MFHLFLIWVGEFALATAIASGPRIIKDEGSFHLDIGKAVQDAVKKFDPYFEVWNETDFIPAVREAYKPSPAQTLSGIVADFNSDKIKDVAMIGRNRTNNLLVAAVSEVAGRYKVIEIVRAPLVDPRREWMESAKGDPTGLLTFLSYQKPGFVTSRFEPKPLQLKSEAFSEQSFEKANVIYYYRDGKFDKFTLEAK